MSCHLFETINKHWGYYIVLHEGSEFRLKRVVILPDQQISLRSYTDRSENITVISGMATITEENKIVRLFENNSIYLPANTKHKISNNSSSNLIFIEIQKGDYTEASVIKYKSNT
jgi:mannose-6-phosphate isomerase-like protein (cupin superfamily)